MRWEARAIIGLCGLAWAIGAACGGGSGSSFVLQLQAGFPQGFLPQTLAGSGGSGDVAFAAAGGLFAVSGSADVSAISREDGTLNVFAGDVGGASTVLLSIAVGSDGRVFVGDDAGNVYEIDSDGISSLLVATGAGAVTGLALAPNGFGELGGALIAAAGASGLLSITTGESPASTPFATPGESYVDVAFSESTLFALDATDAEIDTVDEAGVASSFQGGFLAPVGIAADAATAEIFVADAGDDTLYVVPVAGGAPTALAAYDFDAAPPSGIAFDGIGAVAWVTRGSVVIRAANLPRVDPANPNFGLLFAGPTTGFGDLEFELGGGFLLVANDTDDPDVEGDAVENFLFAVSRDAAIANLIASNLGEPGELLLSLAHDPKSDTTYIGTGSGDVLRRDADGSVSQLVDAASPDALLGLELAPGGFGAHGGKLVATTAGGEVLLIDPASPVPSLLTTIETTTMEPAPLSDLVFSESGTLYVLDNGSSPSPGDPRVLVVAPDGSFSDLGVAPAELGLPDGIEIDEGGGRLLIATSIADEDLLVEVSLADASLSPIGSVPIDDGFFPTGVVYDRLGGAVVRSGDAFTALAAFSVAP